MTDKQMNKLMMFRAVGDYLALNRGKFASNEILAGIVERLRRSIAEIENAAEKHGTITKGKTDLKYEALERMVSQLKLLGALLYTYAHHTRQLDLKAITSKKTWQIREMRDEERLRHAMSVQAEVDSRIAELSGYGITSEMAEDLRSAISCYQNAYMTRDGSVSQRSVVTAGISEMFDKVCVLLAEELDPMMELFRAADPQFFDEYRSLRVTKALASRRKKNGEAAVAPVIEADAPHM